MEALERCLPYETETAGYRELFPHCRRGLVYLDHAATGPLPIPVIEAVHRHLQRRHMGQADLDWELERAERLRALVAELIGAPSGETIALVPNTTSGLAAIALSLPWDPGDVVLVGAQEFPANVYPWRALQRFGVCLRFIPMPDGMLPPDRLAEVLDERVRVVAVSAVQFLSGYRADLEALGRMCRDNGSLLIVDGIQAVGAVRVDVQRAHVAALACGGAKWLLAPHGTGFLYVAPELIERLTPAVLGWLAAENPWDFFAFDQPLARTARRFEGGSLNIGGITGFCAAVEMLLAYGSHRVEERVLALSGYLIDLCRNRLPEVEMVTPGKPEWRAGIVTFRLSNPAIAERLVNELSRLQIRCSARMHYVRLSPHWYNTAMELEQAVAAVERILISSD
ncbi:MAG: aminotransferase class V-fold PLP-dependent enzyme [Candidatus Kapabacteria bacterium]|nr:aminotransferase class V-fold PLP-dependent enzyme [Candidatus Kapabacteria bacterium]MCS7168997.1 aminotransferase class V-fold PLP-dependent enzyme [Candidatus Kapabacteria bacterium]MDW7997205.1 aminotransferase class V-fold PLP-dependent enzyme [Bacteroidota bacterium]MDW8224768.1 aminotransferase class V-fold PLP-dependent enzyme [Bacteroidota bacterium]